MAPQVGLEPTTLRLTVARTRDLPFTENCDWPQNRWTWRRSEAIVKATEYRG
jgi:hypothetical protein